MFLTGQCVIYDIKHVIFKYSLDLRNTLFVYAMQLQHELQRNQTKDLNTNCHESLTKLCSVKVCCP